MVFGWHDLRQFEEFHINMDPMQEFDSKFEKGEEAFASEDVISAGQTKTSITLMSRL